MKNIVKTLTRIAALVALCSSLSACVTTEDYSAFYYNPGLYQNQVATGTVPQGYDFYAINQRRF